ncbi:5-carboxymethyl-2-hydroxymuconate Delta-isomerase [Streptomyces sp. ISL-100]|uniref:5-carboxymethyl-2-hydroxymuconate Delta-isomerase n=1 Tax=Streptomyces sp. ISL-100 TaxID=2819173 RepID=UPI001BE88045|nr:isomerase [Streptomyces sp. ISL-100]MBT2401463.1 isomerase [Streptomyces sp. ISL-100]
MPQITVDYSEQLAGAFDRRGFALALHPLVVDIVDTQLAACKTRFRRVDETVVADAATGHTLVHIGIALLPGRAPELKAQLTTAVLDLVAQYVKPVDGTTGPHISAEVRDLEASYRKR